MTAATERVAAGAALLDERPCEAISGFAAMYFGIEDPCDTPAVGQFTRICVHEHLRTGWLCRHHSENTANCRTCFDLPGTSHLCPVTIVPAGAS